MSFNKGDVVCINWEMTSLKGKSYPAGTECVVLQEGKLETKDKEIIPVDVSERTCTLAYWLKTKLGRVLK